MRTDSRLSRVLHVLMHLDEFDKPIPSEMIALMLKTNPALVRRTMGGLKKSGLVGSNKGQNGGWYLKKPLSEISLRDVYIALGEPKLFALGVTDNSPTCLLEKAANKATLDALDAAQETFENSLNGLNVSDLVDEVREEVNQFRLRGGASGSNV